MRALVAVLVSLSASLVAGCGDDEVVPAPDARTADATPQDDAAAPDAGTPSVVMVASDFEDGALQGFTVGQSDFTADTIGVTTGEVRDLGPPLTGKGLEITADNNSDDLWAFVARELTVDDGLVPATTYAVTLTVELATNTPTGCIGVGGSPDSLFLKGGVVDAQPRALPPDADGYVGFSADKGQQSNVGTEAVDLGTIGSSSNDCTGDPPWERVIRTGTMTATSTADGRLWVYVGTDSAFESASTYAYDRIAVALTPP